MDFLASPLVTIVLNIIASALVSKGIIDSTHKDALMQLMNNLLSAIVTIVVATFSIYKIVDLHKHKLTMSAPDASLIPKTPQEPSIPPASTTIQDPYQVPIPTYKS